LKSEVCLMAATGMLGSGYKLETFYRALDYNPDVIGCDAGSSDPGPYYLGIGIPRTSKASVKRDLLPMIREGVRRGIPVVVGSAGTSGGDPHVDWTVEIVKEIAEENCLHFKLAVIKSEITKETLLKYIKANKMKPLEGAPEFLESDVERIERCVSVMGAEPFVKALQDGAQVIIAGRSSDTAIYAAMPILHGFNNGSAWHAAKLLECGAASVVSRTHPDCMVAWVREDSLSVEPPNPDMVSTPVSCVSHTLYENANPFVLAEPSGYLNTANSIYEAETERRVRITGSVFEPSKQYTIKLEAVEKIGHRRVVIGGIRDPLIIRQLDSFLETCYTKVQDKVESSLGLTPDTYRMRYLTYGNSKVDLAGEIGVLWEVIGRTESEADALIACIWHFILHAPIAEWSGLQSQFAFPFSPPSLNGGVAFSFCLNHILEVEDPLELVRFQYEEL